MTCSVSHVGVTSQIDFSLRWECLFLCEQRDEVICVWDAFTHELKAKPQVPPCHLWQLSQILLVPFQSAATLWSRCHLFSDPCLRAPFLMSRPLLELSAGIYRHPALALSPPSRTWLRPSAPSEPNSDDPPQAVAPTWCNLLRWTPASSSRRGTHTAHHGSSGDEQLTLCRQGNG